MPEFTPERLDLARRRRGYTKTELAQLVGVSTRTLTFYGSVGREPSSETLQGIARALDFPVAFFFKTAPVEPEDESVSFRSLQAMSRKQRDMSISAAAIALEFDEWIHDRFSLPEPDVPTLRGDDMEAAADAVRDLWNLGQRRVPNMVHVLEKHGVRVYSLSEEGAEVDAFSFWQDGVPYVFLNSMKSMERGRMDAAHELGHLVLHRHGGAEGRLAEEQAKAFAAAFLMPRRSVIADAPRPGSAAQIIAAKVNWGVSAMALAYRMAKIGVISEWHARNVYTHLSRLGYRKGEPDSARTPRERSQILEKVFAALLDEGIGKSEIARALAISTREINRTAFGTVLNAVVGNGSSTVPPPKGRNLRLA